MKKIIRTTIYFLAGAALLLPTAGFAADVCGEGIGIPPFLSSGAKPNLLMVLDNSGSMLDAAYSKTGNILDADGNVITDTGGTKMSYQRCLDGDYTITEGDETIVAVTGYESTKTYGGYFENDQWYQWTREAGTYAYSSWRSGTAYSVGDRVYDYGNIYVASSAGTSDGTTIDKDAGVDWDHLFYLRRWTNDTAYAAGTFVWYGSQLYYTATGGTSSDTDDTDGLKLSDDTGITDWTSVDSTWQSTKSYVAGDIVTYNGIYYEALGGSTSKTPDMHEGVSWQSLRQGAFQEISATNACSGATGTAYTRSDALCLTLDETVVPKKVTAFAALGNFLNWAMASKFDVEKKILTGGKYNYYEGVMVPEHRGCSGSRFVKQVKLDNNAGYLSLGIRGSKYDEADPFMKDRIDTADDTARLEILAVTADGFKPSAECQEMLDTILTKEQSGANWSNAIDTCFDSFPDNNSELTDQNPVLNHSLQFCSKLNTDNLRDINTTKGDCENLYTGHTMSRSYEPSELEPSYGAYLCFGIYDSAVSHSERAGYIGRCWQSSVGLFKTCEPKPASVSEESPENGCTGDPCTYLYNGELYLNETPVSGDVRYNYKCDPDRYECTDNSIDCCKPHSQDEVGDRQYWDQQYLWKKTNGEYEGGCDGPDDIAPGATEADWENASDSDAVEECIVQASIDYCNDTSVPEVIDPSDQAGDTTTYWNIPGVLTDSQLMAQIGGTHPLAVMKGYIQEDDRPEGIIHSVAQDLRLGVMSFNYVGAATECMPENLTSGIDRYCPVDNKDGAILFTALEAGDLVVDTSDATYDSGKRRHVDDLAEAVNSIQATSWTPLGEALYGALGYYTQNINFCLNLDADGKCLDWCLELDADGNCIDLADEDPVQYWCQDNHILVITEGESTADINADVAAFPTGTDDPRFLSGEPLDNLTDMLIGDNDGDTAAGCADGIYSGTYLDDMTWWGQNALPLYKDRYFIDPDGNQTPKQTIYTHIVTTGSLTEGGTGECDPAALMQAAAVNGGTDNYYPGENPQELEDNLYAVLGSIMSRSSSGSAASVISDSRSGAGAMYQAVFWPEHEDNAQPTHNKVSWIGDVRALLLDSYGLMYEDTDQDGKLDASADKQVVFYYSRNVKRTRGCYNIEAYNNGPDNTAGTEDDYQCPGDLDPERVPCCDDSSNPDCTPGSAECASWVAECTAADDCVETTDIKYLWSANKQLMEMDVINDRKIFTWNDANNNGIVDATNGVDEWFQLNKDTNWAGLNTTAADSGTRGPVTEDFLTPDDWGTFVGDDGTGRELDALKALTAWLQGEDPLYNDPLTELDPDTKEPLDEEEYGTDFNGNGRYDKLLRSRQFTFADGEIKEWRLGDVIHSAPTSISRPAESYDQIYRDPTYAKFAEKWADRRNVIYFGGNDGMLHAVNGGFHLEEGNQFCCTDETATAADGKTVCASPPTDGKCSGSPNLGEELWAYIPYNLQPHLKCLADKFYTHKYFVDKKPRMFDVQIFPEESACSDPTSSDCIHPGGWGTILVGGMRFGGAPIDAKDLNDFTDAGGQEDLRQFASSFFILDITNPDPNKPPVLLGELTRTTELDDVGDNKYVDLNYTTSTPAMVVMRENLPLKTSSGNVKSEWYLVMGNGPTELDGTNAVDEQGRLAILPLAWLKGEAGGWAGGIPSSMVGTSKAIRIPNAKPDSASEGGRFLVPKGGSPATDPGYISDIISVDFNIGANALDDLGVRYRTDAVYFGTVDGTDFNEYPADYYVSGADQLYWNGGGRIFRMVTKIMDSDAAEEASSPSDWATAWTDHLPYYKGPVRMLADLKEPVISGPSVGFDGDNYWIYAGTGRFHSEKDKTDDGWCLPPADTACNDRSNTAFFGLKEPIKDEDSTFDNWGAGKAPTSSIDCDDTVMTWGMIDWDINVPANTNGDVSLVSPPPNNALDTNAPFGQRGLMQTDNILVENGTGYLGCFYCAMDGSTYKCKPLVDSKCFNVPDAAYAPPEEELGKGQLWDKDEGQYTFPKLVDYIAGTGCQTVTGLLGGDKRIATGLDGWYHIFHDPRERNLGTSALLGEMLYFTTYQPFNDKCKAEGQSFLYALYYQTGTASVADVIGTFDPTTGATKDHNDPDPLTHNQHKLLVPGLVMPPTLAQGPGGLAAIITDASGKTEKKEVGTAGGINSGRINWTDRCQ